MKRVSKAVLFMGLFLIIIVVAAVAIIIANNQTSPVVVAIKPTPTATTQISTPTALPTLAPPTSTPTAVPSPTPPPTATPTPEISSTPSDDLDTPEVTINPNLTITGTISLTNPQNSLPTPNFGPNPTPPPTLAVNLPPLATISATTQPTTTPSKTATVSVITSTATLPHDGFVVATQNGLFWLNRNGDAQKAIITGTLFTAPRISPDGHYIVALRTDPISQKSAPYLITPDGHSQPLLNNGDNLLTLNAAWSPDGKTLALTRAQDTNEDGSPDESSDSIWLYTLANQNLRKIDAGRDPVWSPDGARIAFIIPGPSSGQIDPATQQPQIGPNKIAVYNLQENAERTLVDAATNLQFALQGATDNPAISGKKANLRYFKELNWSPDGKLIGASADAVTGDNLPIGLILTLTLDNPTPKILTSGNQAAGYFNWSPDGTQLAFEGIPQYPLTPNSSHDIGILQDANQAGPLITKTFFGSAISRTETSQPHWIDKGQALAFLQGDFHSLSVRDSTGEEQMLISGCLGFDWF